MKTFIKYFFLLIVVCYITFVSITDNQISCYVKSYFMDYNKNFVKIITLENEDLDTLISNNPSVKFYFFTTYCPPCENKIIKATGYDSIENIKEIYINIDNKFALDYLNDSILIKNNNLKKVYHLSDNACSGMYYKKGKMIIEKYAKNLNCRNAYPIILYSNNNGKITECKRNHKK